MASREDPAPTRGRPPNWDEIAADFGTRVRYWREQRGLTQEQLAAYAALSRNQVQNIEHSRNNNRAEDGRRIGGSANPRLDTIWMLAIALEIDVSELVGKHSEAIVVDEEAGQPQR